MRLIILKAISIIILSGLALLTHASDSTSQNDDAISAAHQVMQDFMRTFNDRDEDAWAATFNYPHIRFASGSVKVANDASDITDGMDFRIFAKQTGWHHSAWDSIDIIDSGENKVHFKVQFTRYKDDGTVLAIYKSLYVVTQKDGQWGIQARSSFAP